MLNLGCHLRVDIVHEWSTRIGYGAGDGCGMTDLMKLPVTVDGRNVRSRSGFTPKRFNGTVSGRPVAGVHRRWRPADAVDRGICTRLACGVIALALTLSACGGSTRPSSSPPPTSLGDSTTSTTPSAPSSADNSGDVSADPISPALPGRVAFRRYLDATKTTGALFTSNTDGGQEHRVLSPPANTEDSEPDWSPDGSRLLFTRRSDVDTDHEAHARWTVASGAGQATALTPGVPSHGDIVPGFDESGSYSPDGTRIAYVHSEGKATQQLQKSNIFIMDARGKDVRQVTRFRDYAGDAGDVQWSPDGKQLVFALSNAAKPAGGRALFVIGADGTRQRRLTPWTLGANGTPDWSRTGLIVFRAVQDEESGIGNFFTIHPDGTGLTQVTHFTAAVISHKVGFSPDGRWIVFGERTEGAANDLFVSKIDGTAIQPVTHTALEEGAPDWTASTS